MKSLTTIPLMPPLRHLTTIVAVDDDPYFLQSLAFHLDRHQRCEAFRDPREALEMLQARLSGPSLLDELASPLDECDLNDLPGDMLDRALRVHCSRIVRIAGEPRRIREVSCVVVDFDMPGLDGVEFCRRLRGQPLRRILLTGKADERVAIRAFNEGLIDCYIFKAGENAAQEIRHRIAEAQEAYFLRATNLMGQVLGADRSFLADAEVVDHIGEELRRAKAVEWFLTVDPPGLLCLDAAGQGMQLLIQSPEEIEGHLETAREQGTLLSAPPGGQGWQPWLCPRPTLAPYTWSIHPAEVRGAGRWRISTVPIPAKTAALVRRASADRRFVLHDPLTAARLTTA